MTAKKKCSHTVPVQPKRVIERVEKPTEKHCLYRVWFSYDGIKSKTPADMTEKSYKVLELEQKILSSPEPITAAVLREYKDAVVAERDEEHSYDEED
jgi:hypothetical protein